MIYLFQQFLHSLYLGIFTSQSVPYVGGRKGRYRPCPANDRSSHCLCLLKLQSWVIISAICSFWQNCASMEKAKVLKRVKWDGFACKYTKYRNWLSNKRSKFTFLCCGKIISILSCATKPIFTRIGAQIRIQKLFRDNKINRLNKYILVAQGTKWDSAYLTLLWGISEVNLFIRSENKHLLTEEWLDCFCIALWKRFPWENKKIDSET